MLSLRSRSHAEGECHATRRLSDGVELLRLNAKRERVEAVNSHHGLEKRSQHFNVEEMIFKQHSPHCYNQ